jgi:GT2 family glycosyltransferase
VFLGFNWAAFAEDLHAVGGFDYRKGPGSPTKSVGQETDMQERLLQAGRHGRYVPGAMVWHYVPRSRCSPDWALERAYRIGVQWGLTRTRSWCQQLYRFALGGKEAVKSLLIFSATRFCRSRQRRFRGDWAIRWLAGYAQGLRLLAARPPDGRAPLQSGHC